MLSQASRLYYCVIAALAALSGVLLVIITIWIGYEAISRSLGLGTLRGGIDFTEHALFSMAFLSAPWILYHDGHISIEVVTDAIPPAHRRLLAMLVESLGIIVCAILAYEATRNLAVSVERGELIFQELVFPEWWLQWQAPLTFALLAIGFARRLGLQISKKIVA